MKKLIYISSIAAPHQIKLCGYLRRYFDAEFWFYEHMAGRPDWWKTNIPSYCKVMNLSFFKKYSRYVSLEFHQRLKKTDPDIVMLGGFFIPSNYLAYLWAIKHSKKVIVFTETFRENSKLREKSILSVLLDLLYKDVDAVFACHEDAAEQMKRMLPNLGERTYSARYAADIDGYFCHPLRKKKEAYTFLFPNRLTDDYNPLLAIKIFHDIRQKYPQSVLKINAQGELYSECQKLSRQLNLNENVKFLTEIKTWDDLPNVYKDSDILIFPAKFSNGNFTILECMASGMGIIISNRIKGQTRLIKTGENGYVCNPDKEEFLKAVQQYIDHPGQFETHAAINREIVRPLSGLGTAELYAKLINEYILN